MRRKKDENGGERKTKWLQLDVETKRKKGQIIYKKCDIYIVHLIYLILVVNCINHCLPYVYVIFSQESERLEMLNSDLKAQIEELKMERQQLILMLNRHRPTCIVRTDSVKTPESEANPLLQQLEAK